MDAKPQAIFLPPVQLLQVLLSWNEIKPEFSGGQGLCQAAPPMALCLLPQLLPQVSGGSFVPSSSCSSHVPPIRQLLTSIPVHAGPSARMPFPLVPDSASELSTGSFP